MRVSRENITATKARSGDRIRIFNPGQPQPWRTIVGVVPDTLMQGPFNQQTDNAGFYVPLLGAVPAPQFCTIIVRPRPGQRADTAGPALSKAVAQLDPNLPTYFAGTPAALHNEILGVNRITATLFAIFGAVAFILSAVGLYGVMSFSVNQRTQEFGIRMALGADAARIFRLVMTQGAWQFGHWAFPRCRWHCAPSQIRRAGRARKFLVQSERVRPVYLFRCGGAANRGRGRFLLRSGSAGDIGRSNRSLAD